MTNIIEIREDVHAKPIRIFCATMLYGIIGVMTLTTVVGILEFIEPLQKIFLGVPVAFVFLVVNTCCAIYGVRKIIGWMRKAIS